MFSFLKFLNQLPILSPWTRGPRNILILKIIRLFESGKNDIVFILYSSRRPGVILIYALFTTLASADSAAYRRVKGSQRIFDKIS